MCRSVYDVYIFCVVAMQKYEHNPELLKCHYLYLLSINLRLESHVW